MIIVNPHHGRIILELGQDRPRKLLIDLCVGCPVPDIEARAAVQNGRGNGALRKIGAVQEGILRKSFLRNGKHLDQALWAILDDDWYRAKAVWGARAS